MSLAGCKQGADDGHILCRRMIAAEEIVLATEGDWPDCILCKHIHFLPFHRMINLQFLLKLSVNKCKNTINEP